MWTEGVLLVLNLYKSVLIFSGRVYLPQSFFRWRFWWFQGGRPDGRTRNCVWSKVVPGPGARCGKIWRENTTERIAEFASMGTQEIRWVWLSKSESWKIGVDFPKKTIEHRKWSENHKRATPGASAKVCSRFWLREIRFPHALEGWVRLGSTAGWFHTSRHGFKMVPPKHQEYSLAGLEQPKTWTMQRLMQEIAPIKLG